MKNILRRGNIGIFAAVVIAVSLALTTAYTVNQNKTTSTAARAQAESLCGSTGEACCPGVFPPFGGTCNHSGLECFGGTCRAKQQPESPPPGSTCQENGGQCIAADNPGICSGTPTTNFSCDANTLCCLPGNNPPPAGNNPDDQYIGQVCTVGDGRQGTCQYTSLGVCSGPGNEQIAGYCPGSSLVQCCVQRTGTGGPPGDPPPAQNPPPAGGPARSNYIIGGLVAKSESGAGLAGVSVTIATVGPDGNTLPINGQPSFTTTTDAAGNWAAQVALAPGDGYSVRPQNPGPAGYASAPRSSNDSHSKGAHLPGNTPISQPSYEQQIVGQQDCSSTPGWPNGACNFVYDPTGGVINPPPAPPAGTKACIVRTGPPPVVELPPEDLNATAKKDMDITIVTFLPTGPGGTVGPDPAETTLPVDVAVTNAAKAEDAEVVTVNMNYKGAGKWEGKYSTQHFPGTSYSFTVWPKKFAKKTICHVGSNSPHIVYPTTYECAENQGTIVLKSGANHLDFSRVKMGAGDLSIEETRDGHVDAQDLYQLVEFIRDPARENVDGADLNLDGQINQADYDLAVWSIQNVPE